MTDLDPFSELIQGEVDAALAVLGPAVVANARQIARHPSTGERLDPSLEYVLADIDNAVLVRCLVVMTEAALRFEDDGHDDAETVAQLVVDTIVVEISARLAGLDPDNLF